MHMAKHVYARTKPVMKSEIKSSEKGKESRRAARRKRMGFDEKKKVSKGVMYSAGAFGQRE